MDETGEGYQPQPENMPQDSFSETGVGPVEIPKPPKKRLFQKVGKAFGIASKPNQPPTPEQVQSQPAQAQVEAPPISTQPARRENLPFQPYAQVPEAQPPQTSETGSEPVQETQAPWVNMAGKGTLNATDLTAGPGRPVSGPGLMPRTAVRSDSTRPNWMEAESGRLAEKKVAAKEALRQQVQAQQ